MSYKISDIPVHNATPGGSNKIEMENPTGPASEWCTLAELIANLITGRVINTRTASYTLALTDPGGIVEMNVASANNLTVPNNTTVAIPVGSQIDLAQIGAGQTTLVAASGVTIRSSGGKLKITGQYSTATLYKRATNEWVLSGDISA